MRHVAQPEKMGALIVTAAGNYNYTASEATTCDQYRHVNLLHNNGARAGGARPPACVFNLLGQHARLDLPPCTCCYGVIANGVANGERRVQQCNQDHTNMRAV